MSISQIAAATSRPLVSKPNLARELDTTSRTIDRWAADPKLSFPKPVKMARRVYFYQDEIEAWKLSRVRASTGRAGR